MKERSALIEWLRGELVGPSRPLSDPVPIWFTGADFDDPEPQRRGPLCWRPVETDAQEEVLYYERETPHRKYGAGLLHPAAPATHLIVPPPEAAANAADTLGVEPEEADLSPETPSEGSSDDENNNTSPSLEEQPDDFEVTSPDVRYPSTIGISFCVRMGEAGRLVVRLPSSRRFPWQSEEEPAFPLNGRYELCKRRWSDDHGTPREAPMWRRYRAIAPDTEIVVEASALVHGRAIPYPITMPDGSPIVLRLDVFPRVVGGHGDTWLITVVLRNVSASASDHEPKGAILYQTYFEVATENSAFAPYPESTRPFEQLDQDEQSLALLYREARTWGMGHGCAAGWEEPLGATPRIVYADVMPAVELPSMTPDVVTSTGEPLRLAMRSLAELSEDREGLAWASLINLAEEYAKWIERRRDDLDGLPEHLRSVGAIHLESCTTCLRRIEAGIALLKRDDRVLRAFRFANLSMLLQQIAAKQLTRRPLAWDAARRIATPKGENVSPWQVYLTRGECGDIGWWRAFQIAFLLMSLEGVAKGQSPDRSVVDLIWFPTGGGKTEAYLGVLAFYAFHERLLMEESTGLPRDGTNVLMRYTLRMLTTQQFQRAASLICAMEFLRRHPAMHGIGPIVGGRFSLGLWIGGEGSPNTIVGARADLGGFRRGFEDGNPLVLTECPWCRAEIGRLDGAKPTVTPKLSDNQWHLARTRGITDVADEGPLLHCPDNRCAFGLEHWHTWLPVEVIDERIYRSSPTLVIATADKLAIVAYRPEAGALFGRSFAGDNPRQVRVPPGLIIQDELHLISGPLGTMYGHYEGVFERLCSSEEGDTWVKPKLIASTATIRGASQQVLALYARNYTSLFPAPGLAMGDSFFGTYARADDGRLKPGRLYLGIHASDYGSVLTTQVRVFASALFRPFALEVDKRDPWWSLLVFYNSIRELSGAKTLFDSDIRSRLKFLFNREQFSSSSRRTLSIVEELTSRLSQAEIVGMLDRLSTAYAASSKSVIDACLASNIIEVGVDIERLSLMGVVGQPKTTAQYIQVTGRVGRRWAQRPGLVMMVYNPNKSRDRSHFEQFHSYHRRLYERVEPTSATPFAISAIQRALPGALIAWARQQSKAPVQAHGAYATALAYAFDLLRTRCSSVQTPEDVPRSLEELVRVKCDLEEKWSLNPQRWEEFPPSVEGEYLMLWPGQFATRLQRDRGVIIPNSMRQVDGSAELIITQGYALSRSAARGEGTH